MDRKRVTRKEFAELAKSDPGLSLAIRKSFDTEIKQEGDVADPRDGGVLSFIISTGSVDREGDTVAPKGWELKNFIKSGTVLAQHDTRNPIARPFDTHIDGDALKSKAEFPSSETHEFGNLQFRLLQAGILRGTSVGFRPLEWSFNEERPSSGWMPAIDFTRQELLEFSIVSVPANADALLDAKSKGFDLGPMQRWAEQMMDETPEGLSVTREQLEALRKDLAPTSAPVPADVEPSQPGSEPPESTGGLAKMLADLVVIVSTVSDGVDANGETLTDRNADTMRRAADLIAETLHSVEVGQDEPDPEPDPETGDHKAEIDAIVERSVAASLNSPEAIVQRALSKDSEALALDLRRTRGALP